MKRPVLITILFIAASNIAVYGIPYMKSQFYDIMRLSMGLSHGQIGLLFSVYGGVSMAAYLLGGPLVDRFSSKKLLGTGLALSAVLHLIVLSAPAFPVLAVCFALFAVSSILLFYPVSVKVLASLKHGQGGVFGAYAAFTYIISLAVSGIGLLFLLVFSSVAAFRAAVILYVVIHAFAFTLLFLYREPPRETAGDGSAGFAAELKKVLSDYLVCLRSTVIWRLILLFFCNYLTVSALTYVISYFSDVYALGEGVIMIISIVRVNILVILFTPLSGRIADRTGSVLRVVGIASLLTAILAIPLVISTLTALPAACAVIIVLAVSAAAAAAKGLTMATLSECKITGERMGTAVGLISFFGYSPDMFFFGAAGRLLDVDLLSGYRVIFLIALAGSALVACVCASLRKSFRLSRPPAPRRRQPSRHCAHGPRRAPGRTPSPQTGHRCADRTRPS